MIIINKEFELIDKIESIRKEMIQIGLQEGLNCRKVVVISQNLDTYITQYQRLKNQNNK